MPETILSKRRKELKDKLRQKALHKLERAAAMLYNEGAAEVYVFGSVLKPWEFNERSDVDIAVRGIPEGIMANITARLEEVFGETPFDIISLKDDLRPEIRAKIEKEGILWKR
jgi:predicted nucleotidyltransferase